MLFHKALAPLLAFTASATATIIATDDVPLLGPSYMANFDPSTSKSILSAKSSFPSLVEKLFSSSVLNRTDLVFTIDVYSAATNRSIYNYSHVGEGQNATLTSGELNDETISRLGSVTKLFTVYAIIAKGGIEVLGDPVTKYIPELGGNSSSNPLERVDWDEITVGALAAHQAGSGGPADFIAKYGPDMTATDLFDFMRDEKRPVIAPYRNAVYSDAGYAVLGQVLARLSGQTYTEAIRDILSKPLGLEGVSTTAPTGKGINVIDRTAVDNTSFWAGAIPIVFSSGGIYANTASLRTTGLSILNSQLLSPATTRAWMKPLSGTGSLVELVGAPWEISRLTIPVTPKSNRTRVCDVYSKAGGNGDYTAIFGLSPDHGIGYSILIAGSTASSARWPLRDLVGEVFVPAAEHAAVENARENLVGTFVSEDFEGTNLTLTVDEGRPGLGLDSLYLNGTEFRSQLVGSEKVSTRLYPTGINSLSRSLSALYKPNATMQVAHRMAGSGLPLKPRAAVEGGKGGLFDNSFVWANFGFAGDLDEFVLDLVDGRVVGVKNTGLDVVFKRVD